MSEENAEMLKRAIEAWNAGDLDCFLESWHAAAEWRPAFPKGSEGTGSVFRGPEGVAEARINVRGATSGVEIDAHWSAVVRFKDGQIVSAWDWLDHASALEAAGLSE
jgi:ketosteroid isomerase-like protein